MKKLFVVLFVMFFAGIMMAQDNTATVTQDGDGNDGTITQSGSSNTGEILQDATSGGNGNFALIEQLSSDDQGKIDQDGDNDAEILQEALEGVGGGNLANITQTGTFDRTYNAYGQTVRNGYGKVHQMGANNDAIIVQVGGSGRVDITQTGNENYAIHDQGTDGYSKSYIYATITQNGNYNEAYQWKQSTAGVNHMNITQVGGVDELSGNKATQDLSQERFLQGNDMDITQTGNSNEATQTVLSLDAYGVSGNSMTITQTDDSNIAIQLANDNSNVLTITQIGDLNGATQTAITSGNTSTITQTGGMNTAVTLQQ